MLDYVINRYKLFIFKTNFLAFHFATASFHYLLWSIVVTLNSFFLLQRIAGADSTMQQTFTNALGSAPYTAENVKGAINTLNNKRKERLMLLLDYIEDQGEHSVVFLANLSLFSFFQTYNNM